MRPPPELLFFNLRNSALLPFAPREIIYVFFKQFSSLVFKPFSVTVASPHVLLGIVYDLTNNSLAVQTEVPPQIFICFSYFIPFVKFCKHKSTLFLGRKRF